MNKKISIILAIFLVLGFAIVSPQNIFATGCESEVPDVPPEDPPPNPGNDGNSDAEQAEPISLWNGEFYTVETPLVISSRGFQFKFEMTYRSRLQMLGALGHNWDYNLNNRVKELENSDVKWMRGNGRVNLFTLSGSVYQPPSGLFVNLIKNPDNTFTITEKNGTTYNFNLPNPDGLCKVSSITDRNDNTMSFNYTGSLLSSVTDTAGRTIDFAYDGEDRITQITDFAGRNVDFYYDTEGDLISITRPATAAFPSGVTKQFTYSSGFEEAVLNHNLLTITDARDNVVVETTYDGNDRAIEQLWCDNLYTFTYDTVENITVEIDPNGNVRELQFNELGNLLQVTKFTRDVRPGDPPAYITQYEYNSEGLKTKTIFAKGNVTKTTYDEANSDRLAQSNILSIRQKASDGPDSSSDIVTSFTYEPTYNLVSAITDPLNSITGYTYDGNGNLTKVTDVSSNETDYTYDSYGQVLTTTDANENTTGYTYDSTGSLTRVTDPLLKETDFSYDNVGNIASVTDAKDNVTSYTYDDLNQLLTITYHDQTQVVYVYDANGNRSSVKDQKSNTTKYTYDILNRLIKVEDATEGITQYTYDANGNRLSVIDANGNTTGYTYDELNRLYQTTTPLGHQSAYSYNLNSNRSIFADAKGNTINYTYDPYNRLAQILYPDSSVVAFAYDKAGRKTSMTDATGTTTYTYDNLNRLTQVNGPESNDTISYTYNAVGSRLTMTDQDGGITQYTYDELNRLIKVTDPSDEETAYTYDDVSNLTKILYPNSTEANYAFNALNRLLTLTNEKANEDVISLYSYTYDDNGMRTGVTLDNGDTIVYTYDAINQLTGEYKANSAAQELYSHNYGFDAAGNRLELTKLTYEPGAGTPPLQGCVACWHMDEESWNGTAGEVTDSSSNENHGTAQNDLNTIANGNLGRCGSFDGVDDYINCGTNLGLSGDFEGTIEAWFKADELKYQAIIVAGKAKTLQSFALFLFPDGEVSCAFNGGINYISAANTYTTGQWYHLVATKTPGLVSTQTKLYLNGVEISGSGPASTPNFVPDVCYIGQWTNGDYHFNGKIDEAGIYDRALSAEEIYQHYLEGVKDNRAKWKLDEGEGTTAEDSSGNGNDGTLINMDPDFCWVDGKIGKALQFDGVDDYINCGTNLGLSGDFEGTIEAWFKADELKYQAIIVAGKAKTLQSFALFLFPNGEVSCAFNGGINYISAANTYTTGQWYHLVATKTPGLVSTQTKLYLNGVEISGSGPASTPNFVPDVCYIGQWTNGDYHFNGKIDEAGIYDRALSAEEIQNLYGRSTVANYTYNEENQLTSVISDQLSVISYDYDNNGNLIEKNSSSNGNHGTAQNDLNTVAGGKIGRCGSFDGVDDYINCGTNLGLSGDFEGTIEAWFKADELKYQSIIVAGKHKTLQSFALFLFPDGEVSCAFNGGINYTSAANTYTTGQWYHLVVTKTPGLVSTQTKLYLNGVEISGSGPASTPNFVPDVCYIGQWTNGDYHFNGKIDDVRIYDRALSADEVYDLYTEPGAPPLQGCAAYWHMNEESWNGTADEVTDSSKEGITTYTYDYENRLTEITYPDNSSSEYTYDGAGKRIKVVEKDSQGEVTKTTKFLYDGLNVIIERDAEDQTTAIYTRGQSYGGGIGGIISKKTSAGTNYYHYDGIGNVTGLTDVNEAVVQTYVYEAYGNLLSSTGTETNNHLFSTKEHSAKSGLVYFGARYYDPRIGRFITKDPLTWGPDDPRILASSGHPLNPLIKYIILAIGNENPQLQHPYMYCLNNPVNLIDPWGLCTKDMNDEAIADADLTPLPPQPPKTSKLKKLQDWLMPTPTPPGIEPGGPGGFGGGGGGGCFIKGTLIQLRDTSEFIEKIKIGDNVLAYDLLTGKVIDREVVSTFALIKNKFISIYLPSTKITVTPEHRFYVKERDWVEAKYLKTGDQLLNRANEWVEVKDVISITKENTRVYNLEVKDVHNYFISKSGVLAHNIKTMGAYPGGGTQACFLGNTILYTKKGSVVIQNLEIGDKIKTFNVSTRKIEYKKITCKYSGISGKYYRISIGQEKIICTRNHKFWVKDQGWIPAYKLNNKDCVFAGSGEYKQIFSISKIEKDIPKLIFYNVEVEDNENYFVGKNEVLVGDRWNLNYSLSNF